MAAKPAFPRFTIRAHSTLITGLLAGTLTVTSALADTSYEPDAARSGGYYTYADVISVRPLYGVHRVSEPVRRCETVSRRPAHPASRYRGRHSDHYARQQGDGSAAAGLLGGLVGGLIGHQFGDGNGRKALTVAGALLGASIASDRARGRHHDARGYARENMTVRRCTEVMQSRQERQVHGYDVRYRYQGRTFNKRVDEHPGEVVRIHVDVEPMP
ncbi:MAG: glycine zipper 2TM domain-containing protein [Gammaproteobacteria bacterium]|nr:glycine zipper 2TM domain-containing protein [Gammaproteobacteria bacterium]